MVQVISHDVEAPTLENCKGTWELRETGSSDIPLLLEVFDKPETLEVQLTFQEQYTSSEDARHLLDMVKALLQSVRPEVHLSGLLSSDAGFAEDSDVSYWSHGSESSVSGLTVDLLLRRQAELSSDTVAVVDAAGFSLSYSKFDARVNSLSRLLVDRGVEVGSRVAVILPRSIDLIVTLASVIRAGAVYVPVDPEYPHERITQILEDAVPTVVVTNHATFTNHRSAIDNLTAVLVDQPAVQAKLASELNRPPLLSRSILPEDSVYLMYTSGTTGQPKGVQLSHAAVVNRLLWGQDALGFTASDRVLLKTPMTFDVSVPEFFLPLIVGSSVVVADDGAHGNPDYIARVVRDLGVTSVHFVPSMLQAFLEAGHEPGSFPGVRLVSFSGEALPVTAALEAREIFNRADLFNLYGPTEAAVEITSYDIAGLDKDASRTPIGRPIANSSVRVLDSWLRPVPVGVIGELYLSGVQLADGYVNRYALTSERFVADPTTNDGCRLYRTGDLVRWDATGQLIYLGRTDDQVKIRGFRIELDEIRSVLEQHKAVSGAVVLAARHPAGGKYLVAYYTSENLVDEAILVESLRAHMSDRLPAYMLPNRYIHLDKFPTSNSGKLDYRALPEPDTAQTYGAVREPKTETEVSIARIFRKVLHLCDDDKLSVDDDFFRIGGHSLLATRVAAQVNEYLGSDLSLREVFESPTIAGLARILEEGNNAVGTHVPTVRVGKVKRPEELPVSFGQQSLWVIDQLGGPGGRYVVPISSRLSGALDETALLQAICDVVVRHEALRTLIVQEMNDQLMQVIVPPRKALSRLVVISEDFTSAHRVEADARVAELVQTPFDLASDIPIRAGLLRTGEAEWMLVLAVHHHAVDEWSMPSLLVDLSMAYRARLEGMEPNWLPLPLQYADYAIWHRTVLGSENDPDSLLSMQLKYWKKTLAQAPEQSTLCLDRPRPAEPSYRGEELLFQIDAEVSAGVRRVADKRGLSMFMIAQAVTALTVSALSGSDEVVIGSPVGGRTEDGLEEVIGYFVNTLPIRHHFDGSDTIGDVLDRARQSVLAGFAHQLVPFEHITHAVGADRAVNRNPVFQVMLTYQHHTNTQPPLLLPGVKTSPLSVSLGAVKTDIDLYLADAQDGISGFLSYATDIFDRPTIDRFVLIFERIMKVVATNPDQRIAGLNLLSIEENEQLIELSTGEKLEQITVDSLLRQQAANSPYAVAVVTTHKKQWSYSMLDNRVNALSQLLVDYGVRVGSRVAILLPRSANLVTVLAAVIRAGAVYVPIDTEYPAKRVAMALEDTEPAVVVTDEATLTTQPKLIDHVTVLIDNQIVRSRLQAGQTEAPVLDRPITPGDGAAVIFTSGTTGRPKAVQLSHSALVNRLIWGRDELALHSESVALFKSGLGFVDATTELLGPLISGASVVIASEEEARDPASLVALIAESQITHLLTVPSLANAICNIPEVFKFLGSLKSWVCSGEVLTTNTVSAIKQVAPDVVVRNFYGSTEITGDATISIMGSDDAVTIGTPVANIRVRVLDRWLRPLPAGVKGELYVGGEQLADGYLAQSDLTAERFVADPHSKSGGRLYRTGDFVSWSRDGRLKYHGRTDDQVKIRGFRIELNEIRTVLEQHPEINSAVVVAAEHIAGDKYLAAYIMTSSAVPVDESLVHSFREYVAKLLPEYMVPVVYIRVDEFPTTHNGKIDLHSLPAPNRSKSSGAVLAPDTVTERSVARIFHEVLHLAEDTQLSKDDDFFHLGGHSLMATRVVAKLNSLTGSALTLRDIFDGPTIAGIAHSIDKETKAARNTVPTMRVGKVKRPAVLPVSFGQQSLWLIDQLGGPTNRYVVPFTVHIFGDLNVNALKQAVTDVIGRHETLRTLIQEKNDGELAQLIISADEAAFRFTLTTEDFTLTHDTAVEKRVTEIIQSGFDLAIDIPIRVRLLRTGMSEWVFVLTMHHHAVDEWSLPSLLADLTAAYKARVDFMEPHWTPLPVQYADYAIWQRAVLGSSEDPSSLLSQHLEYWRVTLEDAPAESTITLDRNRPLIPTHQGADAGFILEASTTAALRKIANELNVTMFMVTHAVTALAVSALGAGNDVVIGAPVGGRTEEGLEDIVGFFVNTLPLRYRFSPYETLKDVLEQARKTVLDGFEHQAAPFEKIAAAIDADSSVNRNPIFQIMLTYQNTAVHQDAEPFLGLESEQTGTSLGAVKSDIDLYLFDSPKNLTWSLTYSTDLFDQSTIERFLHVIRLLLNAIAEDSGQTIAEIDLLPETYDLATIEDSGGPQQNNIDEMTVTDLLHKQVISSPHDIALVAGDQSYTFSEFYSEVNRYARLLMAHSVRPEHRVALLLPRDERMVIAMFAVFSVGAAYVPIDTVLPDDRISYMLEIAEPTVTLVTGTHVARLGADAGKVIALDDTAVQSQLNELAMMPISVAERGCAISPGNLAYIIFTSGSTGLPKGVAIEYRGLTNMYTNHVTKIFDRVVAHQGGRRMRIAHTTSFSFDASWEQLFWMLNGHEVHVINEEMRRDPQSLLKHYDETRIDGFDVTPSYGQILVDEGVLERDRPSGKSVSADVPGVVFVSLGGEAVSESLWKQLREAPGVEAYNLYGPTEYTINALGANLADSRTPSVGTPIFNTKAYILDENLRLTPPGVSGELYLEGIGIARGYWVQAALTAERFVACPWNPGRRMYRTGDLARINQEGEIDYLGRTDEQITIRGYRIEPNEICTVLEQHKEVSNAVVVAADHPAGGKGLVAYYTPGNAASTDENFSAGLLREYLTAQLPDYMVPNNIIRVKAFPLTSNGKLNQRALPEPESRHVASSYREAESETERILATIVREVLTISEETSFSVNDDFFQLGGDSILSIKLVSRARKAGLEVSVAEVFRSRTVSGLASIIETQLEKIHYQREK